jgi:nucleoside-diphosphate kinase
MNKERTLVLLKPDAVQRGIIGKIITRFEMKGIKIVAMKFLIVSQELAEKHYYIHKGKKFFEPTINYIRSSPIIAIVLEGNNVIEIVRGMIGATDPQKASMGTIRGDFGQFIGRNIIHGSDGPENADYEIKLWFKSNEIFNYKRIDEDWIEE